MHEGGRLHQDVAVGHEYVRRCGTGVGESVGGRANQCDRYGERPRTGVTRVRRNSGDAKRAARREAVEVSVGVQQRGVVADAD